MVYAVNGRASVRQDPLQDVPFNMCCFDIKIEAVRNALFYGAQLSSVPQFVKIYDQRAAEKLDEQVFAAMKKPSERSLGFCCLFRRMLLHVLILSRFIRVLANFDVFRKLWNDTAYHIGKF